MAYFVDPKKCVACWGCLLSCPTSAIVQNSATAVIIPERCTDCGICAWVCPVEAIESTGEMPDLDVFAFENVAEKITPERVEEYDLVVLGGGPAGLTAGYYAAKSGLGVAIVERRKKFGYPVACAEGISVEGLSRAFDVRPGWVSSPIEGAKLFAPGGRVVFVDHPDAGYVLDRPTVESDLAQMCRQEGAQIFHPFAVRKILGDDRVEGVLIEGAGQTVMLRAKFFIGADGVSGISARWCFPNSVIGLGDLHSCAQVLVESPGAGAEPITEFWWGTQLAPGGYAWVFPKAGDFANVGLGIVPSVSRYPAEVYLKRFLARRFGEEGYRVVERRDGVVHTRGRFSPMGRANMLLVGDAAGLANPISGGGLDSAFASGKIAAQILTSMWNADYDDILKKYEKALFDVKGRYLDIYAKIRHGILKLSDRDMDAIAEILDKMLGGKRWYGLDIPAVVKQIVFSSPTLLSIAGKIIVNI